MTSDATIDQISATSYTIPTDSPEADGTFRWDSTTLVLIEIRCEEQSGVGYTYGHKATCALAQSLGERCLAGGSALDIPRLHAAMVAQVRNDGSRGIASLAISALDVALWDLKAKLLDCSIMQLLGNAQRSVAAYGSGGFTSYSDRQLKEQLGGWARSGLKSVKMKIGSDPATDPARVASAREAVGPEVALFVDANGAYTVKQASALAERFAEQGVTWFEEPVSSDHLSDMRRVRDSVPHGMNIAAGEYGYDSFYFRRMLEAEAVDVLQLDATRCKGFTGFLAGAAIADSFGCPVSAHCAPSLHMHVACAVPGFLNIEYFHDHARIEQMLFDGFIAPKDGRLEPDRSRPGLGLAFKHQDAERFRD